MCFNYNYKYINVKYISVKYILMECTKERKGKKEIGNIGSYCSVISNQSM